MTLRPEGAIDADVPLWPVRVQLRREPGWRKPPGAVSVARPHRFGNPYRDDDAEVAVARYVDALATGRLPYSLADVRAELHGRDLLCWCRPGQPCHADALLAIANGGGCPDHAGQGTRRRDR